MTAMTALAARATTAVAAGCLYQQRHAVTAIAATATTTTNQRTNRPNTNNNCNNSNSCNTCHNNEVIRKPVGKSFHLSSCSKTSSTKFGKPGICNSRLVEQRTEELYRYLLLRLHRWIHARLRKRQRQSLCAFYIAATHPRKGTCKNFPDSVNVLNWA